MTSKINDLKNQHISDKVKKVDDKVNKNRTGILSFKSSLDQEKSTIDDLEREASFSRGFYYYSRQSYLFLNHSLNHSVEMEESLIVAYQQEFITTVTVLSSVKNSNTDSPTLLNKNNRLGVTFNGNYMKQNKLGYAHGTAVNIYIVYELKNRSTDGADFTVSNGLLGGVKLTKNANTLYYKYSGYGFAFDSGGSFTSGNINNSKNGIIFGVNTQNSIHSTNKTQNIYVMDKDFVQGINNTTIYAAKKIYKTNFTEHSKNFVLSLHDNGDNSYLFVNGGQELKFKSAINYKDRDLLCLRNISSDWSLTNSGLYGNIYDFAVDYVPLSGVKTIYDIHRYLMKSIIYKMFSLLNKLVILILFGHGLGNIIKNISGNFEIFTRDTPNCYLLKKSRI